MNGNSLISIVIPVYNVKTYLPWCLDSVLSQTYANIEVILINDGSTDGSKLVCDEYALRDSRIRVIHQVNAGPSVARNNALDLISGEYVTFVDGDDLIHPRYIETLYRNLCNNDAQISSVTFKWMMGDFNTIPNEEITGTVIKFTAEDAIAEVLYQTHNKMDSGTCAKLYRVTLFDGIRFPENKLYEDLSALPRLYEKATTIVHQLAPIYYYRQRNTSLMNSFSLKRADVLDVTDEIVEHVKIHHSSLLPAAYDRKFSANMNILWLMSTTGISSVEIVNRCWSNIKELRLSSLFNRRVRLKNKIGAIASFGGLWLLCRIFKLFKPKCQ